MINIPSTISDPNHRYKMPRMNLKVEGKGNGIMTNVTNLDEIAKALRIPTEYPLKFFGIELGSLTKIKPGSFIVNGKQDPGTMTKVMDKFIEKYILCPICKLPEMGIKVKKETLKGICRSCGKVSKLDSSHAVAKHILKNPPADNSEFEKEHKKKAKDLKKEKEKEAGKKKDDKKPKSKKNEGDLIGTMEDVSLASAELAEAIARIKEYKNSQKRTPQELIDELSKICATQQLKGDMKYYAAIHGLFEEDFLDQLAKLPNLKEAIRSMVKQDNVNGQCWLILSLQHFVFKTYQEKLSQHINTIMKFFYDEEVLEEGLILKLFGGNADGEENKESTLLMKGRTFNKDLNLQFRKAIDPFVDWLK